MLIHSLKTLIYLTLNFKNMEYLRIKEIKTGFLFSMISLTISLILLFVITFSIWIGPSFLQTSLDFPNFLFQEIFLSFFLYPTFLIMILYIVPRMYKIPCVSSKKVNIFYIGVLLLFVLKVFLYLELRSQTLFLYSMESLMVFLVCFDIFSVASRKREVPKILSFLFVFVLLPIFRYISMANTKFLPLFLTFSIFSLFPILLYMSFEIAFFYKTKKIRNLLISLLSISFLLLSLYPIFQEGLIKWISLILLLSSLVIFLSNSKIEELIFTKKLYKRSLLISIFILLLSFFSITRISDYLGYLLGFSIIFYSLYSFQFLSFFLEIFPSITFSLYPVEESKSMVFWYMMLATFFFFVSAIFKGVLIEGMLAGYTLLIIASLITLREAIFLSSTL